MQQNSSEEVPWDLIEGEAKSVNSKRTFSELSTQAPLINLEEIKKQIKKELRAEIEQQLNDDELGVDVEREAVALKESFRLHCSQYFLTYSGLARMPTDAEVRALIDKIAQTKPVKFWHYAADKHDDTEGYHIHLLVDYGTRIDVKGEAAKLYFDWTFPTAKGGTTVHPNIRKKSKGQKAKNFNNEKIEYCWHHKINVSSHDWNFYTSSANFIRVKADREAFKWEMEYKNLRDPFPFKDPNGKEILAPEVSKKDCCYWIWGEASYGKTQWINDQFKGSKVLMPRSKQIDHLWDQYIDQRVIILDEIIVPLDTLCDWSNTYTFNTFLKARYNNKKALVGTRPVIIQLTNKHPGKCYFPKNYEVQLMGNDKSFRNAKGEWVTEQKYTQAELDDEYKERVEPFYTRFEVIHVVRSVNNELSDQIRQKFLNSFNFM